MTDKEKSRMERLEQMQKQKEMMKGMYKFQGLYFVILIFDLAVIYYLPLRDAIGGAFQTAFGPLIGFNFQYPVLTIALSGIITGVVTGIPRYYFTDWVRLGKVQKRSQAYSKALNQAYKESDRDKVNKLRKMQQEHMMDQQRIQMSSQTPLIFLSFFTILIFVWLYYFLSNLKFAFISLPWASNLDLNASFAVFPNWIIVSFISNLTVGYFVTMVIKYVDFSLKAMRFSQEQTGS
ncbi:MAG: EMC3/TMCO1 family protein [Candidatus Thermoplasmatota archaeon]|jgi:uncharacterized membrane protein (DUF106 family)|nr:EMC3/TMCO1 family protein [Candidatus Thermoplasmatota archaeon]